SPLLATMTGSSTRWAGLQCSMRSATARVTSFCPSMPIFTASIRTSANKVSICAVTNSCGTAEMAVTPWVCCAVSAATTARPYAPSALMALMSASMPAPPDGSTPAMVRVFGIMGSGLGLDQAFGGRAGIGAVELARYPTGQEGFASRLHRLVHGTGHKDRILG